MKLYPGAELTNIDNKAGTMTCFVTEHSGRHRGLHILTAGHGCTDNGEPTGKVLTGTWLFLGICGEGIAQIVGVDPDTDTGLAKVDDEYVQALAQQNFCVNGTLDQFTGRLYSNEIDQKVLSLFGQKSCTNVPLTATATLNETRIKMGVVTQAGDSGAPMYHGGKIAGMFGNYMRGFSYGEDINSILNTGIPRIQTDDGRMLLGDWEVATWSNSAVWKRAAAASSGCDCTLL